MACIWMACICMAYVCMQASEAYIRAHIHVYSYIVHIYIIHTGLDHTSTVTHIYKMCIHTSQVLEQQQ